MFMYIFEKYKHTITDNKIYILINSIFKDNNLKMAQFIFKNFENEISPLGNIFFCNDYENKIINVKHKNSPIISTLQRK